MRVNILSAAVDYARSLFNMTSLLILVLRHSASSMARSIGTQTPTKCFAISGLHCETTNSKVRGLW